MNLKKLTTLSLFLAIGFILHQISPPIFFGIKPDFLLTMMVMSLLFCESYKETLIVSIVFGMFAALTTGFPGGQIPNIIDKIISAALIYNIKTHFTKKNYFKVPILAFLCTLVSGIVFLISVSFIMSLPTNIFILFATIVIPTSLINTIVSLAIYNLIVRITGLKTL